jgi:hypothetical protein
MSEMEFTEDWLERYSRHISAAGRWCRRPSFDAKDMSFDNVTIEANPSCATCGEHPTIHELVDDEEPVCGLKTVRGKTDYHASDG